MSTDKSEIKTPLMNFTMFCSVLFCCTLKLLRRKKHVDKDEESLLE